MKSIVILFISCLSTFSSIVGQTLKGKVSDIETEEAVFAARIWVNNDSLNIYRTDLNGNFKVPNVKKEKGIIHIESFGYEKKSQEYDISKGEVQIFIQSSNLLKEFELNTTRIPVVGISTSPIKTELLESSVIERYTLPTAGIMESIKLVSGVQEVVACGVCYTNSISINGFDGAYTAVTVDGMPMYGNLASVYGLNGIPNQLIERIEIVKGPNSVNYGSEAVAGIINIITKNPKQQPKLNASFTSSTHGEYSSNISFASKTEKVNGSFALSTYNTSANFDDFNNDFFNDRILIDRYTFFTKQSFQRKEPNLPFNIAAKLMYEDRRNGVENFISGHKSFRGDTSIYGESIITKRAELFGNYRIKSRNFLQLDYSFSFHHQDSYYGSDYYKAKQYITFTNLYSKTSLNKNNTLLYGLNMRYQHYDDNTIATETVENNKITNDASKQIIPGIYIEDEFRKGKWHLLIGSRLDYYQDNGLIPSPRINTKYNISNWTNLRLNLGTGFRIVNLFTEDHAFVSGQREVEITESLNPERSLNASLSFQHTYALAGSGNFIIDGFYTYFNNKILPDYDTDPSKIIYNNTDGYAVSKGLGFGINHTFKFPLTFSINYTLLDAKTFEKNTIGGYNSDDVEFAPNWTGTILLTYEWIKAGVIFSYSSNLNGQMALPEIYDLDNNGNPLPYSRPTTSNAFSIHNIVINKQIKQFKLILGLNNIFNYRQSISPLSGYNDPNSPVGFSDYFDTSYAYSTIHGREIYIGVNWVLK